jgi:molybdopterin-guanine dinucleotide biosynthesis protein A
VRIAALHVSPGHNYFGHHGREPGAHAIEEVAAVECLAGRGLRGDRFLDYKPDYGGQVTFFAEEVHRELRRRPDTPPHPAHAYRRNVLTRGVDLGALIGREFTVQGVRFQGVAECRPCAWMDRAVTPGTEARLRGQGGLRARVLSDGWLRVDCPTAAALLLAGGRARRLGRDKATLPWGPSTLGEHQAGTLARIGCWPLWLACRAEQPWTPAGFRRFEDPPDQGGVIEALIGALANSPLPVLAVLAVDLPGVPAASLEASVDRARERGLSVVPRAVGQHQPLAAAWHRSALPELQAALGRGDSLQVVCRRLSEQGLLEEPEAAPADAASIFANLNTPEDLARWSSNLRKIPGAGSGSEPAASV